MDDDSAREEPLVAPSGDAESAPLPSESSSQGADIAEVLDAEIVSAPESEEDRDPVPAAEVVEAVLLDAPIDEPTPAESATDYIVAEIVNEVVDDPPAPEIRIGAPASPADYDHEARVRKFDRGGITAGSHRYRRRGRRFSLLLASLGFLAVLGVFTLIKIAAEMPEYEEFAESWSAADEWYEDEAWRENHAVRESEQARRAELRKLYEEVQRVQSELQPDSTESAPPPIENLEQVILADADWPDSALSHIPLAGEDEPLRQRPFHGEQRVTEYFSTTQYVGGDGLRARHTRIVSPHRGRKLIDAAWSADGKTIYTLDDAGFVTKVFVDPLNAALTTRLENAVGIEFCKVGVLVARPTTLLVLDPVTLSPRDQFMGLACEEASAGVDGDRVVLAAFGGLSVLDLQRKVLAHRLGRASSRPMLAGRYRRSDLAAAFKHPVVWPDGESFLALSDGRVCQFHQQYNDLQLTHIGPQRGRVRATAVGSSEEGVGVFLFAGKANADANADANDRSEARWFAAYSPEELFDAVKPDRDVIGVAMSGAEGGPTFFLDEHGRCSRYPAERNGAASRVNLLGDREDIRLSPSHCRIVADPHHPRAAVFHDESLWIVEPAADGE